MLIREPYKFYASFILIILYTSYTASAILLLYEDVNIYPDCSHIIINTFMVLVYSLAGMTLFMYITIALAQGISSSKLCNSLFVIAVTCCWIYFDVALLAIGLSVKVGNFDFIDDIYKCHEIIPNLYIFNEVAFWRSLITVPAPVFLFISWQRRKLAHVE
jgi:hypothetical protein